MEKFFAFDKIPVGVCVINNDFVVIFWNTCLENWTGIDRKKIIGTDITSPFPHLKEKKYFIRLQNIFQGGPPTIFSSQLHKYIFPSLCRDGQCRIQHTTVTPLPVSNGKEHYALFVVQDVTDLTYRIDGYRAIHKKAMEEIKERKHAETALQKAHERLEQRVKERTAELVALNEQLRQEINVRLKTEDELRTFVSTLDTLVNHIPDGIVLLDHDDRVILANPTGEEYLKRIAGITRGERLTHIAGSPVKSFVTSESRKPWFEVRIYEPQESVFELAGRMIGQNNTLNGVVLVLKDVTVERMLEERVNSQERIATVGQLAAGIAHDFNNILTGIIGFADLILSDIVLPDSGRQMVESILQNGQRASQLIRQILDFSSKSISEMKSVDLLPFLEEFSRFISRTIPENIQISIDSSPGTYRVWADPTKMQQVLTNLSVNARDAMPNGGSLRLKLERRVMKPGERNQGLDMTNGNWIILSVSDTGTGIPSESLAHMFEPFFTTKRLGQGTGLGLSQVYGIVKQHNGHIEVETEVGKGSTFYVYLPECTRITMSTLGQDEFISPRGSNELILVVEDNEGVRDLIKRKLQKLDYAVLTASNGKEALKLIDEKHDEIKVVFTDIVMPEMGGMELCRSIRFKNPSIKVVGLSGYPLGAKMEDLRKAGIVEYIQKPFKGRTLEEVLCRTLEKKIN